MGLFLLSMFAAILGELALAVKEHERDVQRVEEELERGGLPPGPGED